MQERAAGGAWKLSLGLLLLFGGAGCTENAGESLGTGRQQLVNGAPVTPPTGRHVMLDDGLGHIASGTILNDEWVLTVAHGVDNAASAGAVVILTDSNADLPPRHGAEVRIHPLYLGNPDRPQDVDIALVRVDRPFANVTPITLSNVPTSDVVGQTIECFGYGRFRRGINQARTAVDAPPLHSAKFVAQPFNFQGQKVLDPAAFQLVVPINGEDQIIAGGDSGGGCFVGEPGEETLVGVMKAVTNENRECTLNTDCPLDGEGNLGRCIQKLVNTGIGHCDSDAQQSGFLQASESFIGFARAITHAPASGSLASQSSSDRVSLRLDGDGKYEFFIEYEDGQSFVVPTGIIDPGTNTLAQLELHDFDGDGRDDLMFLAQGTPLGSQQQLSLGYLATSRLLGSPPDWTKLVLTSFVQGSQLFVPIPLTTISGQLADANEDGFGDLVTVSSDGSQQVFFGRESDGISRTAALAFATPDIDADGARDLVTVSDSGGVIALNWRPASGQQISPAITTIPYDPDLPISLLSANFNADAKGDDLVLLAQGSAAYYEANGFGTAPFKRFLFDSLANTENALAVRLLPQTDGGGPDVEVTTSDQFLTVYRGGSSGGLNANSSSLMWGLPTEYTSDGKLLTVSGSGRQTVAEPRSSLKVAVDEATADVEIFDANYAGFNDSGPAPAETCFQLWTDPCGDGLGECANGATPELVVAGLGSTFPENDWGVLYRGPNVGQASPSGTFFYRLEVYLSSDATCASALNEIDDAVDATKAGWNGFKVRSNGQLSALFGQLTVIAADAATTFGKNGLSWMADTDYDGSFAFAFDVSEAGEGIGLKEADADDLADEDAPGVAEGANLSIYHELVNPDGDSVELNRVDAQSNLTPVGDTIVQNVSGNFDAAGPDKDIESYRLEAGVEPGLWLWFWGDVWVQNNIHVFAPEASPVTYEMLSPASLRTGRGRSSPSSALSRSSWLSSPTGSYLPLVLGSTEGASPAGASVVVSSSSQASGLLSQSGSLSDRIKAELLAAKLNVARSEQLGERLSTALLYGATSSVRATLAQADAAVRGPFSLVPQADAERVLRRLRAINSGAVSYFRPGVPYPAAGGDDDDQDGVLNFRDNCPTIANEDQHDTDGDKVGDACRVVPFVSCVSELPDGKLKGFFGYDNPLVYRSIPPGPRNLLGSAQTPQVQPLEFTGGHVARSFSSVFDRSASIAWQIEQQTVQASAGSPRCNGSELTQLPFEPQVAIFGQDALTLSDSVSVKLANGDANVVGGGTVELGANARVGDVLARGNLTLRSSARVTGKALSSGSIVRQQGATVAGPSLDHVYVEPYRLDWAPVFASASVDIRLEPGVSRTLTPGNYRDVSLKSNANLSLAAGQYYFTSLMLEPGAKLTLPANGQVVILVKNALTSRGTIVRVGGGDPQLTLGYFGQNAAFLESSFSGTVIAPIAELVLGTGPSSTMRGVFFAKRVQVRAGVLVVYDPLD